MNSAIGDVGIDTPSQISLDAGDGVDAASTSQPPSSEPEGQWAGRKVFTECSVRHFNDMREQGQLCDAIIHTQDGTVFPVHRNIMATSSDYFKAQFRNRDLQLAGDYRELRQQQVIILDDVMPDLFTYLVDYAYSRPVILTVDNVQNIFAAADRFLMPGLVTECCRFMRQHLCPENCLGMAALARAYFRPGLEKAAMAYAQSHFAEVVDSSQEFLEIDGERLCSYFASDYLNAKSEEHVFEAICKWIRHDPERRVCFVSRLLRCVRMGRLSVTYLVEKMKKHEYISDTPTAKAIVIDALKYVCNFGTYSQYKHMEAGMAMAKPRVPHEILFVIGGWSGGSPTDIIETYDSRAGRWLVCRPPGSEPRAYHACVVLGRTIYVVGGFNGAEYFSSCRKFDPLAIRWYPSPPMHSKRCYVSGVGLRGYVYALGGFDGHVRLNTVEKFDPKTNQWSWVLPMIQQRSDAKATILDEKIYICGGFNGQECLSTGECYDPDTNQWTLITPMRNRRSGVGVIALRGCIYALGGFNGITRMNTAERFEPTTTTTSQQWMPIADMTSPRSNFALGVTDDLLYVIGGFNGVTTISLVECYDPLADQWTEITNLSLFRSALSACVVAELPNVRDYVFKPPRPPSPVCGPVGSRLAFGSLTYDDPDYEETPDTETDVPPVPAPFALQEGSLGAAINDVNVQQDNAPDLDDDLLNQLQ